MIKKLFIVLILSVVLLLFSAKSDDSDNYSSWTGTKLLGDEYIAYYSDGFIYATGLKIKSLSKDNLTKELDLSVVKYDSNGIKLWTRLLGAYGVFAFPTEITTDLKGNIYITGYTNANLDGQPITGKWDLFIVKYDSDGYKQWIRLLNVSSIVTVGTGIKSDSSGNIYVTGVTFDYLNGQPEAGAKDIFVVKFDENGIKQWIELLNISVNKSLGTITLDIILDSNGEVYVTGSTESNIDGQKKTGIQDLFVSKINSNGIKQWTKLLGAPMSITNASSITADSSGNIYITGDTNGNLDGQIKTGKKDFLLIKCNSNGIKQWTRLLGVVKSDTWAKRMSIDHFGFLYASGFTNGNLDGQIKTGKIDTFVVKYDSNGIKQ